eukprot:363075-Chlamydomonas_euryale.AAC.3
MRQHVRVLARPNAVGETPGPQPRQKNPGSSDTVFRHIQALQVDSTGCLDNHAATGLHGNDAVRPMPSPQQQRRAVMSGVHGVGDAAGVGVVGVGRFRGRGPVQRPDRRARGRGLRTVHVDEAAGRGAAGRGVDQPVRGTGRRCNHGACRAADIVQVSGRGRAQGRRGVAHLLDTIHACA